MQSIPYLWKQNFKKNKKEDFVYDNIFGLQTKKDFILKSYFISQKLKQIDGENIGIMLPAVSGASLLILSSYLAGKIPVMFNWTLPENAFHHCVNFSKVEKILTVKSFYDRIKTDFLEKYEKEGKIIFLEDILKESKITEKLKAFLNSIFMPIPKYNENDIAVVLFTSGSESLPKAVPLTHKNLIENIKGATSIFKVQEDDILLGFLPPFHSFGFTVNTIMPLISGMRVVYTPDPNDAKTILEIIKHTKPTAITATPTFLKMIMSLASGDDLKSIKYAVVGAEKCPQDVFDRFKELSPNGKILEGYGITECSPVVAINPIKGAKPGTVGKIIPNLDCMILGLQDLEKIENGELIMDNENVCHSCESRNLPNIKELRAKNGEIRGNKEDPVSSTGGQTINSEINSEGQKLNNSKIDSKNIFGKSSEQSSEISFQSSENLQVESSAIPSPGMILVSGSSIFNGYLDKNIESPFIEVNGKKYYKTGDLGFLDEDGFLTITGRLKRFIKIAGEMVSLPALEETILKRYGKEGELNLAVEALEKDGNVKIVLFTTDNINVDEVNEYIHKNGIPNLVKINEVQKIDEIPVLGTGKTDYKVLKKRISFEEKKQNNYKFENVEETLKQKISDLTGVDVSKIDHNKVFGKDIYIDSIDVGELMIFIRKNYNIEKQIKVEKIKTFGDLVNLVKNKGIQS